MAKESAFMSTREALKIVVAYGFKRTLPSMLKWCTKYKLGKKVGGRFFVNRKKLLAFLKPISPETEVNNAEKNSQRGGGEY